MQVPEWEDLEQERSRSGGRRGTRWSSARRGKKMSKKGLNLSKGTKKRKKNHAKNYIVLKTAALSKFL